jgi:alcohol dehydrogenase class IV
MAFLPSFPPVHFDFGAIEVLPRELAARGVQRPLIITDAGLVKLGTVEKVLAVLPARQHTAVFDGIPPNPTIGGIEGALAVYRERDCDGIVALGGGSVLDSGKALRVAATHPEPIIAYLKDPSKITSRVAPYITIPTTSGTGAEVTFGGGIHPAPGQHQLGIRSPHVRPDLAICDPELTMTLPPRLTAATGMDAFSHCLEGFMSTNLNPPAEAIALDGIARVLRFIERATTDGSDREARSQMLMAALQGGMSIYMGLGPIHTLGHVFADSPIHHGELITASTPAVMRFYARRADDAMRERMARLRQAMALPADADLADAVAALNARLGLCSSVRELGYANTDLDALADYAVNVHFNATAPRKPTREEYRRLIEEALG